MDMTFMRQALRVLIGGSAALALALGALSDAAADDALTTAQAELKQLQQEAARVETDLNNSKNAQAEAQRNYDVTSADLAEQQA